MKYTHLCMKCRAKYDDNDPDEYLCAPCIEKKNAIAKMVDATIASRPKKNRPSLLQEYEAAPKIAGRFQIIKLSDL